MSTAEAVIVEKPPESFSTSLIPNPLQDVKDFLEKRRFKTKDGAEFSFNFLVINSPDKWPIASEITDSYNMPIIGRRESIHFSLRGLSLSEWETIEREHPIPVWDKEGKPDADYVQRRQAASSEKSVHVIETSTGHKFPGESFAEKAKALRKLNDGEVSALYLHIQDYVCALQNGSILQEYNDLQKDRSVSAAEVINFNGFDSWAKANELPYLFRMQRPTQNYILEFPLKNVTTETKLQIELETKDPEPPMQPKRDPQTRRFIPHEMVPNFDDVEWLNRVRAINQKRAVMYFENCLPFTIPGVDEKAKYDWVAARLVGDVYRLKQFIEEEICGYQSRFRSF